MLSLCKTVILLYILGIFVECSHPGSLSVRKLNRQLIARKRQNTLDLCQMFNVENEKAQNELLKHNRVKRAAVPPMEPTEKEKKKVNKLVSSTKPTEKEQKKVNKPVPPAKTVERTQKKVNKLVPPAKPAQKVQKKVNKLVPPTKPANKVQQKVNKLVPPAKPAEKVGKKVNKLLAPIKPAEKEEKKVNKLMPPLKTAERVEKIVDKLYDEEQDETEKVAYRKNNLTTTTLKPEALKPARRFDFAPAILDHSVKESKNEPMDGGGDPGVNNVMVTWHKYWKHGIIPYFIDSNTYDTFLAEKITKAFDNFEQSTCIRLQRLRNKPTDKDSLQYVQWLYITNPSGTRQCVHSNEMKYNTGVQWVVFGYDCMSEGQIMHEVMHILGFSHEHVREDRDQYITVMWDNIKPGYKKFFEVTDRPPILSSLPYDFASVLHYPPRAFSKNGKYTLMAEPGITFGQRDGLSEIDIEKVSMIYSGECIERNRQYLVTTCPTVIASKQVKNTEKATQQEINEYFKDRLWPYGIVNYKIKDNIEFSIEEKQNIEEVMKHIEKETCIEFRDLSEDNDDVETTTGNDDVVQADDGNAIVVPGEDVVLDKESLPKNTAVKSDSSSTSDSDQNKISGAEDDADSEKKKMIWANMTRKGSRRFRRSVPASPSRRHADNLLVLTRSPEPGCRCPEPGVASAQKELVITADCFNSVNDLLHLFVHVLGLDHQHNSHDRDDFLAINWANVTDSLRKELENKLPPAASVGFTYDYQSVMHYPWLDIKDGVTNIMYPVWNDGWAMGHWQGLSSVDVQKLNLLYFIQCQSRKKHIARTLRSKKQ